MGQTRRPVAGDIYRHFKDRLYEIITIAIHSETEEEMVVYRQMYGNLDTYVRPLSMFLSEVDHEKYPEVKQKYRFERIGTLQREEEPEKEKSVLWKEQQVAAGTENKPWEAEQAAETENKSWEAEQMTAKIKAVLQKESETIVSEAVPQKENETAVLEAEPEQDEAIGFLMKFLDAETYGEKLTVLEEVHCELDDKVINNMAISMDLVIEDGTPEERLAELMECIRTKAKYECFRLN